MAALQNKYDIVIIGSGMGLAMFSLLIAVQSTAPSNLLGVITSSTHFFRNIGGVIGTGVFGSVMGISLLRTINQVSDKSLNQELAKILNNPSLVVDPLTRSSLTPRAIEYFSGSLSGALHLIFVIGFFISLLGLLTSFLMPATEVGERKEVSLATQEKINASH